MKIKANWMRMLALALMMAVSNLYAAEDAAVGPISKEQMVYSYEEMLNFNVVEYLAQHAPHLLPYAESISHYAGYSSISPKLLIALMEQQGRVVSRDDENSLKAPFGTLSDRVGFNEQLADISDRLAIAFYRGHSFAETGVNEKRTTDADAVKALEAVYRMANGQAAGKDTPEALERVYRRLFSKSEKPGARELTEPAQSSVTDVTVLSSADGENYFQMPFPVGQSWTFGGSHTNTGSGSYPLSSLDLNQGGSWGSDLSNKFVTAAAPGRVVVHSSCLLEVVHDGGWSTTYYHLSGVRVGNNSYVDRNTYLANYANNINQALCNGGQSSGPHVHFSLKRNGQYYHLNGVGFSGYSVHTGRDSYDSNCSYFWLERNGSFYCAWSWINNLGIEESNEPSIWPMENGQVRSNIYGSQGAYYYYKITVPEGIDKLNIDSYSGTGDADLYVRYDALPTLDSYQCRPYKGDNNESCNFDSPTAGDWYVMLHGATAFSGLSLKTSYSGGYSLNNLSQTQGQWLYYWINVPEGMSKLMVNISGTNGDADMYVKSTGYPNESSYDCRPYESGSTESCSFTNPAGRQWYIGIYAYQGFSGLSLETEWTP